MARMTPERWPERPTGWKDTYATLHMWTQVAGKVALATAPPLNHSWGIALQIMARGPTYRGAATLATWDVAALETPRPLSG